MPLKEAKGNMYSWVSHMHTHLGGECPHKCSYCYVGKNRFGRAPRYTGELKIITYELGLNYGTGKVIFIEHMNDMFAVKVSNMSIQRILAHCREYDNEYVFQTKNPIKAYACREFFPEKSMIGTTIESNFYYEDVHGNAPHPIERQLGIRKLKDCGFKTFLTVEPIMDFDVGSFAIMIINAKPDFINIGADSKNCGLPEPSREKVMELVKRLQDAGIVIRKKFNLERLTAK